MLVPVAVCTITCQLDIAVVELFVTLSLALEKCPPLGAGSVSDAVRPPGVTACATSPVVSSETPCPPPQASRRTTGTASANWLNLIMYIPLCSPLTGLSGLTQTQCNVEATGRGAHSKGQRAQRRTISSIWPGRWEQDPHRFGPRSGGRGRNVAPRVTRAWRRLPQVASGQRECLRSRR